jgi:hypothetical protein
MQLMPRLSPRQFGWKLPVGTVGGRVHSNSDLHGTAFDPNRMNPFMWLYRDRSSPFYSSIGVTENERLVLGWQVREIFRKRRFSGANRLHCWSRITLCRLADYAAFPARLQFDRQDSFALAIMKLFRPFVLVSGEKLS